MTAITINLNNVVKLNEDQYLILREAAIRALEKGLKKIDLATLKEVTGEYK